MEEKRLGIKVSKYDEQTFNQIEKIVAVEENRNKMQDIFKWVKANWVK